MNFSSLILICLGAMLLAQEGDAFRGGFGGGFGRFGFGGFGLGRFGGFGLGLGPWGPFGPFGFGGPFIGKRDVSQNVTECTIASETNSIACSGLSPFTCEISQNFTGMGPFAFAVKDLLITKLVKSEEPVYEFLAQKEVDHKMIADEHTFINPTDNKPIVLSLYWSDKLTDCGFRFKEKVCFEKFETLIKETKPEELEFSLFLSQAAHEVAHE